MGLFKTALPPEPGPRSKPSPRTEAATIARVGETGTLLERLLRFLSPYQPKQIVDGEGKRWGVLAHELGEQPAESFAASFYCSNATDSLGDPTVSVVGGRVTINGTSVVVANDAEFVAPEDDLWIYVTITKDAADGTVSTAILESQTGSVPANTDVILYWPIAYVFEVEPEVFTVKPIWLGDITIALILLCDGQFLNAFGVITPAPEEE